MRRDRFLGMLTAVILTIAACGSDAADTSSGEDAGTTAVEGSTEVPIPDTNEDLADISTATFTNPTVIDNPYLPLAPGSRWSFEGITVEDGEEIDHRVELQVTDLTKVISGIESVVMWDLDFSDDELVEAELAFFAQDDDGNVWHIGEYPEEYEDGELIDNPGWLHGYEDALAGYQMMANPMTGTASYSQGWGPEVEWTDRGQIDAIRGPETAVCVVSDCYTDTLVIAEWALEERDDGVQLKTYARNVGNIKVGFRGDDATQEELELVSYDILQGADLAAMREGALTLEESAYENSPDLYGLTEPSTPRG